MRARVQGRSAGRLGRWGGLEAGIGRKMREREGRGGGRCLEKSGGAKPW